MSLGKASGVPAVEFFNELHLTAKAYKIKVSGGEYTFGPHASAG
jgi:hypothetical protein